MSLGPVAGLVVAAAAAAAAAAITVAASHRALIFLPERTRVCVCVCVCNGRPTTGKLVVRITYALRHSIVALKSSPT